MTGERDKNLYISKALLVSERYSRALPISPESICAAENIRCLPLSYYVSKGMSEKEVFGVWRNCDGALNLFRQKDKRHAVISYNDRCAPHRVRFTLCEELMHLFLGHADDPRSCYTRPEYREDFYSLCEFEAKNAACILLCPPVFFYNYKPTIEEMVDICNISKDCAASIRRFYIANERAITKSMAYSRITLPAITRDPRHRTIMFDDGYEL